MNGLFQRREKMRAAPIFPCGFKTFLRSVCVDTRNSSGFTLIETLVAISILTFSIVAPMSLATQSLTSSYYARDQVTAFHLAQEAIESVRALRDANILFNALGTPTDILSGIPNNTSFTIDTRLPTTDPNYIDETACNSGTCPPLETDGSFYGYGRGASGWATTRFTRTVLATFIDEPDEIRVTVTVSWRTGRFQERTFSISENLYRWVSDSTYSQAGYYAQSSYYSQAGYYAQASYYAQGEYGIGGDDYSQAGYYAQSSYYAQASYYDQASYGGGGGKLICTELYRQGRLPQEWWEADEAFGEGMPSLVMRGYQVWAKPLVALMQRSEVVSEIVARGAMPWAQEMAYQMGAATEGSLVGSVMMAVGIPVSGFIGVLVSLWP